MAEYIEREALIADIEKRYCRPCEAEGKDYNHVRCRACWVDDMVGEIGEAPFEDAAPVVHGRWIYSHEVGCPRKRKCSNCLTAYKDKGTHYCPNCGADMRGE